MSDQSKIEWCDATWSPVVGCTRVSSGCDHCYAVTMTRRLEAMGQTKYAGLVNPGKGHFNGAVRLHPESLDIPLRWRKGRRIFVNPMSDLFHERLSDEAIAAVFGVMAACPQHTFQILTKRPERMRNWFTWIAGWSSAMHPGASPPRSCAKFAHNALRAERRALVTVWGGSSVPSWPLPNVWLGVSVEDQATADERIPLLLQTPAAVRFVSYEPALEAVDFRRAFGSEGPRQTYIEQLDWLIVGGESGPNHREMQVELVEDVARQCDEAGVPLFVKQDSGPRPGMQGRISDALWKRKEFPRACS